MQPTQERQRSGGRWTTAAALLSLLAGLVSATAAHAESRSGRLHVVVLYSDVIGQVAVGQVDEAIRRKLFAAFPRQLELNSDFLDLVRVAGPEYPDVVSRFLQAKHAARQPDLVIVMGSAALQLMLARQETLFPGVPVLFCHVEPREIAALHLPPHVAGVVSGWDFDGQVELALRLLPATRRVVVVLGSTPLERRGEELARQDLARYAGRVAIDYWTGLTMAELERRAAELEAGTVLLFVAFFRDGDGETFVPRTAASRLSAAARVPTFGISASYFGTGILGGSMLDFTSIGEQTGDAAIRILSGQPASEVGVQPWKPGPPRLDARQLARFGIPRRRLPADAVVELATPTVWQAYRWQIVGIAAVLLLETALIAGLLLQRRARLAAERERRQAEERAQRQQAEITHFARIATVGELSAAITHELNQPLTGILSNAQAGQRFLADSTADPGELVEILADVVSDGRRASEVIRRLRALLVRAPQDHQPVDLNEIVEQVTRLVAGDLTLRSASLNLELSPLPLVRGDRVQLQQILLNLFLNGLDAMRACPAQERRLVVRTRALDGPEACVEVSDVGTGIAADVMPRLFEPFFTTKAEGMGMGLPIVRSIVSAHDERIWASNNDGAGATFTIVLPGLPVA